MQTKRKYPRKVAIQAAKDLVTVLEPVTDRLIVAGSLRRGKAQVGDVEMLFVPKMEEEPVDLFGETRQRSLADDALLGLIREGVIEYRPNVNGSRVWGAKNKLAIHVATGVPVDLFTASEANWFNYLVCRTGPAASNMRIAEMAQAKGWKWQPYASGFIRADGKETHRVSSEREVFEFVGLPAVPPAGRG